MADSDELVMVEVANPSGRGHRSPVHFIDLTVDDDSPPPAAAAHGGRHGRNQQRPNARRQVSLLRRTPPAFNRSDSSILGAGHGHANGRRGRGNGPDVIDLTIDDSPEPLEPPVNQHRGNINNADVLMVDERRVHPPLPDAVRAISIGGAIEADALFGNIFLRNHWQNFRANLNLNLERAHPLPNPPGLNYGRAAFDRPEQRPPPGGFSSQPARDGYTRDTTEDMTAVCPHCEKELEYDPGEDKPDTPPAPKRRGKNPRAEHHFWAVRACGHVFCQNCYENRKPSSKNPNAFPALANKKTSVRCAVEACESDVTSATAWVGIYL